MKLVQIFREILLEQMILYHGTSKEQSDNIRKSGFGIGTGMSSESNPNIVFLSTKTGAKYFAKNNLRISNPDIISVKVDGNFFQVDKPTSDFGAFAKIHDEFKIPFVGNPEDRIIDEDAIKIALKKNGYVGVQFKDKNANNVPVWAVFDKKSIEVIN